MRFCEADDITKCENESECNVEDQINSKIEVSPEFHEYVLLVGCHILLGS